MSHKEVERVEGIEPSTKAWEAFVLPLNYTRLKRLTLYQKSEHMRSFYSGNESFTAISRASARTSTLSN